MTSGLADGLSDLENLRSMTLDDALNSFPLSTISPSDMVSLSVSAGSSLRTIGSSLTESRSESDCSELSEELGDLFRSSLIVFDDFEIIVSLSAEYLFSGCFTLSSESESVSYRWAWCWGPCFDAEL